MDPSVDLEALNYTIKVPYNGTGMTGGDSLNADLNIFYDVSYSGLETSILSIYRTRKADSITTLGR